MLLGRGLNRKLRLLGFGLGLDIREGGEYRLLGFAQNLPGDVVLRDPVDHWGEHRYADQVGNHHHTVEGIGNVPGQIFTHHRPAEGGQNEDDPIDLGSLSAEQVLAGLGTVVAPSQDGGIGEEHDRNGHEGPAQPAEIHGKHGAHQVCLGQLHARVFRNGYAGVQVDEA